MGSFLAAVEFLTALTLRRNPVYRADELARARAWYGLVGALMGGVLAAAAWLLTLALPPLAAAGPLLLLWAGLSRFLHLDGVADTADALVHTADSRRALAIMKDSRIGAFGLGAVVLVLLAKFGALASLSPERLWPALIAAPALGRALAAGLSAALPPARAGSGLGAAAGAGPAAAALAGSGLAALAAAGLFCGAPGLWAALAVLAVGAVMGWWFQRRLGGVTGDCLGAAVEAGEAAALLVLAGF
jgi:adenosylcobinamide-GDP ribazoletransferase